MPAHAVEFRPDITRVHLVLAVGAERCIFAGIARGPAVTQTSMGAVSDVMLDGPKPDQLTPASTRSGQSALASSYQ